MGRFVVLLFLKSIYMYLSAFHVEYIIIILDVKGGGAAFFSVEREQSTMEAQAASRTFYSRVHRQA